MDMPLLDALPRARSCASRKVPGDCLTVALAGNPNVGKSTVFNALTGLRQHTGNWPGKTVASARGRFCSRARAYELVDIPGTYSLMAQSPEEDVARRYLCFGAPDAVIVVCDATCLLRNLNLVLQTLEITDRVIVLVNLLDEAKRKHIHIDLDALSHKLGVPVVGAIARKQSTLAGLIAALDALPAADSPAPAVAVRYPASLETAAETLASALPPEFCCGLDRRWLALRLLEGDLSMQQALTEQLGKDPLGMPAVAAAHREAMAFLLAQGITQDGLRSLIVSTLNHAAAEICQDAVRQDGMASTGFDRKLDRILTGRLYGYPLMCLLLLLVLTITIAGANVPSAWLQSLFIRLELWLSTLLTGVHAPAWLHDALVYGVFRVLGRVVSVMLPPMAIFFPFFTLLEDAGYLPRIAFNLDRPFCRCRACGKQALTMCMGFGCNAVGVAGCRIIDSPRERLLAILTNSFVPCNGRFPTLIAILTMFFISAAGGGAGAAFLSALLLTGVILLGILLTFLATRLLSATVLRGTPSAFTLELPPYRRPQVGRVLVRSLLDRTLFVLGRAAAVAAPAGLLLFVLANVTLDGTSILAHAAAFLDPFGRLLGLDGVILLAFILGFPANEIVVPIMLMAYTAQGNMTSLPALQELRVLLIQNGWTPLTALCMLLFTLVHWPCSTTVLTIRKETGSTGWTLLAVLLPTLFGMGLCLITATIGRLFT